MENATKRMHVQRFRSGGPIGASVAGCFPLDHAAFTGSGAARRSVRDRDHERRFGDRSEPARAAVRESRDPAERIAGAPERGPLELTSRECQVLVALAERRNRVVPRTELYELVWHQRMAYRDRSVDVFVRKLRLKLHAACPDWSYIHTHFGVGYRFAPERARD
jgi:DNA-binding response OmpR family regulator